MTRFPRASALLVVAGLWSAATIGPSLHAQTSTPPAPQLILINEIQLKPETAPEWSELQRAEVLPALKKSGQAWRDVWANGPGGDPYLRVVVTPISSIAQFDSPNPLIKAFGDQAFAAYSAKNRRLIAGSRSTIVTTRPTLGFGTRPAIHKLGILTVVNVTNGRAAEFDSFVKSDVVPALKKAGVSYYTVGQVVYGGDSHQYLSLIPAPDYAEIAKGHPLERALGADGVASLLQKTAPFITRVERRIIRYLPELSFGPPTPTSN